MKALRLLVALVSLPFLTSMPVLADGRPAAPNNRTRAQLLLTTTGPGRVLPFHDGQILSVGPTYTMIAVPKHGQAFAGWSYLNVFTLTQVEITLSGGVPLTNTITNTAVSPTSIFSKNRILRFTVQPPLVLFATNGNSLTRQFGFQANFLEPR
jgi:hypothetical protein